MGDKWVQFFEGAVVHEQGQTLSGGQLAPTVLLVYPVLAAALLALLAHRFQGFNLLVDLPFFRCHNPSRLVD